MDAHEIIETIRTAKKRTPVKVYVKGADAAQFHGCKVYGAGDLVVFGDWEEVRPVLEAGTASGQIADYTVENQMRNSAIPLLDVKDIPARIEPGAILRDQVEVGEGAVVMMGAIVNIGAVIGSGTMIDMGAILGGRAETGRNCHVGAGAVLAGVIEPPSAKPVVLEDDVLIGANAVVLEGVRVGKGAVVAAGAVVIEDVPPGAVVAGVPARVIKQASETEAGKIQIVAALREL